MKTPLSIRILLAAGILALGGGAQKALADSHCFYRGSMYSEGAAGCQAGDEYRCKDGEWKSTGLSCKPGDIVASKTCQFDGISYNTGTASCQAGTQFRC